MNPPAISESIRKGAQLLLIAAFLLILWLPTLDSIFHLDATPPANENREFARPPEFKGFKHSKAFLAGSEAYFNDHFGFRKQLVTWNNNWKHKLFHEAPFSSVITGSDGWLFLASYQMVEHYTGLLRWTPDELDAWQKVLEARRDWLARRGIKYLFVVPPDKHSIYAEHLPEWLKKSDQPSKLDQFVAHMKARSTVEILDLRGPLLAAKHKALIYPLTETHWNHLGAFLASEEIIKALARQLPELQPLSPDAFERKSLPDRQGDLARLAGQSQPEPDQFELLPRPPLAPLTQITGKALPQRRWPQPDPVITQNPNARGKAILFRDSFADNLVPFLGHHFGETIYLWRHNWDYAFIEQEKPTVLIDEVLERTFNQQSPLNLLRFHLEQVEHQDRD